MCSGWRSSLSKRNTVSRHASRARGLTGPRRRHRLRVGGRGRRRPAAAARACRGRRGRGARRVARAPIRRRDSGVAASGGIRDDRHAGPAHAGARPPDHDRLKRPTPGARRSARAAAPRRRSRSRGRDARVGDRPRTVSPHTPVTVPASVRPSGSATLTSSAPGWSRGRASAACVGDAARRSHRCGRAPGAPSSPGGSGAARDLGLHARLAARAPASTPSSSR